VKSYTLALAIALPCGAATLTLSPATVKAWDEYIAQERSLMEQKASSGKPFLWADEAPQRLDKLKSGQILIVPFEHQGLRKVPSGLIHHWLGAVFIPDARIQDVLQVIRNYSRYKDLYLPSVTVSKTIARGESQDRFYTRLVNRSILLGSAFETDCESMYIRLDERRAYSFTRSTRIQEIDNYGTPTQRTLREGEGSGILWRLFSVTRYAERDGGVYVEVEAMGLTRDIPASLHWLVDPMVRRISRSALTLSLQQTGKAAQSAAEVAKREHGSSDSSTAHGRGRKSNP